MFTLKNHLCGAVAAVALTIAMVAPAEANVDLCNQNIEASVFSQRHAESCSRHQAQISAMNQEISTLQARINVIKASQGTIPDATTTIYTKGSQRREDAVELIQVASLVIFSLGWVAMVVVAARQHYVPDV